MADLNIRDIDPQLVTRLKLAALQESKTLKDYVIEALNDAADNSEMDAAAAKYSKTMLPQQSKRSKTHAR